MTQEQLYLKKILEIIEEIQDTPSTSFFKKSESYATGYTTALDDLRYACSLSKIALHEHLIIWCSFVPLNAEDEGYVSACSDVLKEVSKMNELESWSFN
jgi:hypothetical protein